MAFVFDGWGQVTTIINVTFETTGGYSTSIAEFSDGSYDFFIRTDGSNIGTDYSVSNIQGSYYFAAEDIDGEGATLPVTLTINDVDISGYTDLKLKVYLAEDDDGSNQDWDEADYVHFDYDIGNSGSFSNLLWIESSGSSNAEPKIDTNFDGTGDGSSITSTFTQFEASIPGTGSLIDIKVTFYLNSGDEDIAIDNIELIGTSGGGPLPEPSNHPTSFVATANSSSSITTTWNDNDGTQAASGFLIFANTTGSFTNPVDGTAQSDDTDLSDGSGKVNVAHGVQTYTWNNGLNASTTYYFKIYPYTNSGVNIDFKTDGTVPSASAKTKYQPQSGDIIITEIMQNPDAVLDNDGEWFEIYNTTYEDIDINGWKISDNGTDNHTITNGGSLIISANGFLVLGNNSNSLTNGGYTCDYQYSGFALANGDDEIILKTSNDVEIDRVEYDGGTNWPDPTGASMVYTGNVTENNNLGSNWTTATSRESSYTGETGDNGSPGSNGSQQKLITVWTGDGNWNSSNTTNWNNGIPGSGNNVNISSGNVTITGNVSSYNLFMADGANLTISSGQTLSVHGTIVLENNGSFINNGTLNNGVAKGDATAVMQRTIDKYTNGADGWHLLASPIGTFNIDGSAFDPGANDDFYGWSENTYTWMNHKAGDPTQMVPGTGYLVSYQTTAIKSFTGFFNNVDVTHNNLSLTTGEGEGYHLLGNPFQSALQWTNTDWTKSNIAAGAKIINSGGTYTDITVGGTDIIPANQGFFIQVTEDVNNSITIPKSQRVHNTTAFYKNNIPNLLTLKADDGEFYVETWIQFMEGSTGSYDEKYDVNFFGGVYNAPYFYSIVEDGDFYLSTNRIPVVEDQYSVNLGFKTFLEREFVLTATNVTSFGEDMDIFLEDLKEAKTIDLKKTPEYIFSASPGDITERFVVHLINSTGFEDLENTEDIKIFVSNNQICVYSNKPVKGSIHVFDIIGKQVMSKLFSGNEGFSFNRSSGYYIVKISTQNSVITKKIFVK